ncbi:hypothetical protein NDU88_000643 [Pleurodeles waltl]|uniref:Uncharacterized protein n=1 Tax=Pleurodeles waltl TaxID=8319 RepID=A0AAV7KN94_PLEWA|nr:hypothetical protein NDU88_000643 [Pleurodeles waltl]
MPSPCSPRPYRGWVWSFPRGPLPLICISGVGGVALPPSPGLAPSVLHLGAAAPLRLQPAPARPARGRRAASHHGAARGAPPGVAPLSTGSLAGFCLSRGFAADSRLGEARQCLPTASLHRA